MNFVAAWSRFICVPWAPKEQSDNDSVKNLNVNKGKCLEPKQGKKWEGQFLDPPIHYK